MRSRFSRSTKSSGDDAFSASSRSRSRTASGLTSPGPSVFSHDRCRRESSSPARSRGGANPKSLSAVFDLAFARRRASSFFEHRISNEAHVVDEVEVRLVVLLLGGQWEAGTTRADLLEIIDADAAV